MNKIILVTLLAINSTAFAQQKTIQERLGYSKETKLLIIHADDIGVSHSENSASIYTMEKGVVNSGSIMVPCPWFPEISDYAKSHPNADIGLHLTLTSEWRNYKWGPVTSKDKVPSLLDEQGYFNSGTLALMKNGKPEEVEMELRAQIERAKKFGIDPTHFEAHMAGAVFNARIPKDLYQARPGIQGPCHFIEGDRKYFQDQSRRLCQRQEHYRRQVYNGNVGNIYPRNE
ncbi:MAG: polysaccharide deacetylase family protein [Bacteroidota bacterium]